MPRTPMRPLGLGNVSPPARRGIADEPNAVTIRTAVAAVMSVTPVINRRDGHVWRCGVRSMVHLSRSNPLPSLGRTVEPVARNVRVPVHERAGWVFLPGPHVQRI